MIAVAAPDAGSTVLTERGFLVTTNDFNAGYVRGFSIFPESSSVSLKSLKSPRVGGLLAE